MAVIFTNKQELV